MVRNLARSLTRTASAAAKAVGGRGKASPEPTTEDAPAEKAAAKKAPVKKAAAKKAPVKKAPVKKAAAKKAAAAKAPAKKAPGTKAPVTKAGARNTSAASLPVREGESKWTAKERAEVVADLIGQREHSVVLMAAQSDELSGLMTDAGDGAGHDQADVGSTTFERDHELTILRSERDKVEQIDRALTRIADGSYGACESCGEPIGKMRLMAFPRATLCMSCKQREERR